MFTGSPNIVSVERTTTKYRPRSVVDTRELSQDFKRRADESTIYQSQHTRSGATYRYRGPAMIAIYRVRDAMGRERWVEQPIDELATLWESYGAAGEDDLEEIRRRR